MRRVQLSTRVTPKPVTSSVRSTQRHWWGRRRRIEVVTDRLCLELLIDGSPLQDVVRDALAWPEVAEMPRLDADYPDEVAATLGSLRGETRGDFDDGRVALLACPVCSDLGCRALSAELAVGPDEVVWRRLGWQVNYEPFTADDEPPELGPYRFDRSQYMQALDDIEQLAAQFRPVEGE